MATIDWNSFFGGFLCGCAFLSALLIWTSRGERR